MKKLFSFLVLLLASFSMWAQYAPSARSLRVMNQTQCYVYFQVFGDEPCICGERFTSKEFALAPGGTMDFPNSVTLGGTYPSTPMGIVGAYIFDALKQCQLGRKGVVGQPQDRCRYPLTYGHYVGFNPDCRDCGRILATWVPARGCEEYAQLRFTY